MRASGVADIDPADIRITTRGDVPGSAPPYAREKVAAVVGRSRDPILYAEVVLTQEANPAHERPAQAEATLDVGGRPVRAHVAASEAREAVDLLEERLARRLARHEERRHRQGRDQRDTGRRADGWRHGDLPVQRPQHYDRPLDERELVRTKSFEVVPLPVDEAAFALDMSGHDAYLFTEEATGAEALLSYREDGQLGLQRPEGVGEGVVVDGAVEVVLGPPAPTLTVEEAIERLAAGGEPFVFFVQAETGRGALAYVRYDGHWGLVTPG